MRAMLPVTRKSVSRGHIDHAVCYLFTFSNYVLLFVCRNKTALPIFKLILDKNTFSSSDFECELRTWPIVVMATMNHQISRSKVISFESIIRTHTRTHTHAHTHTSDRRHYLDQLWSVINKIKMAEANENHTAFNVIQTSKVHQKVGPLEFCFSIEFSNEIKLVHRQWSHDLIVSFGSYSYISTVQPERLHNRVLYRFGICPGRYLSHIRCTVRYHRIR